MATTSTLMNKPIGNIDAEVSDHDSCCGVWPSRQQPQLREMLWALADDDEEEEEDYEQNPHDNEDYECEECGDCEECCKIGDCTSKNSFSNQGQWKLDLGLYASCPHCEPYGGADRPVMANDLYECKGFPGIVDNCLLKCVPVEELIIKGLFVPK